MIFKSVFRSASCPPSVRTAAVELAGARGAEVSEIAMDADSPLLRLVTTVQLLD